MNRPPWDPLFQLGDRPAIARCLGRFVRDAPDMQTPAFWRRVWAEELRRRGEGP